MPGIALTAVTPSEAVTQMSTSLADFSATNVLMVIAGGLAIAVPLVLTWFAFRWIYRKAKGALMSGR